MATRKLKAVVSDFIASRVIAPESRMKLAPPSLAVLIAMSTFEGAKEATGNNDGSLINGINATTGTEPRSSYCQNAYQSAVRYVENIQKIVSPLYCSGNSQEVFHNSPANCRIALENIRPGDCLIYQHGKSSSGHSACVVIPYPDLGICHTTEMNTSAGSGVNSNGDGGYFRIRSLLTEGQEMHLIGAVRAFPDLA